MTTSFAHDTPALAETYDRVSNSQFESGKRLLDRIGVEAGDRVLDVGCGTGRLARFIAERVGPSGRVVAIDPLAERIAIARKHAPEITFEVGQAEDLAAFASESFDAVCLSAVFHWLSDKPKALSEIRRVLRRGGRMGATTLPRELMGAGTVANALAPLLGQAPFAETVDLSAVAFATRGHTITETIAMLIESGLELTELHVHERQRKYATGDEVVDFIDSSSFGNFFRIVPEALRPPLRAALIAAFEARKGPDGIVTRDYGMVFVARRAR